MGRVKRIITTVAHGIFGWEGALEDSIRAYETSAEFEDMEHVQSHYFDNGGLFLVALAGDKVIGSGAVRKLDPATAELKRMWLMDAFQGRGIGYALITKLFEFARQRDYARVVLQTSPEQTRALAFYRRVGFREIPTYNDNRDEVSMEIALAGTKSMGSRLTA